MVNKRRHTQVANLEDMNNYLNSENQNLRKKNEELAKALSETKLEYQKMFAVNTEFHGRMHSVELERLKYQELMKSMANHIEIHVKQLMNLTEQMTNTLQKAKIFSDVDAFHQYINMSSSLENLSHSPNKTMAVMPMIDGHTILSPKINLPRVTVKQLTHMMHNNSNESISNNDMEADEIEFADNVSMNENDSGDDSYVSNDQSNRRLETMQEEDEEEDVTTSQPLLSGVFKDVKVYISPLRSQHIIQFKNKLSSRKSNRKDINRTINSLSVERSNNNTSEDINLTQRNDQTLDTDEYSTINGSKHVTMKKIRNGISVSNEMTTSNEMAADTQEYDPLEGPSGLLNVMQEVPSPYNYIPKETSTPLPSNNEKKESSLDFDEPKTPRPMSNITKRKSSRGISIPSPKMSNCSVKLQRLSNSKLESYTSSNNLSPNKLPETTLRDREDSPTVLEKSSRRSSSSSSIQSRSSKMRKRSSLESRSSSTSGARKRRNIKAVVYKEPSLRLKMRQ